MLRLKFTGNKGGQGNYHGKGKGGEGEERKCVCMQREKERNGREGESAGTCTKMSGIYREDALREGQPSLWTVKFRVRGQGMPGRN